MEPPPANGGLDYQLGGPYAPEESVQIVIRDRAVEPVDGLYSVCYVNALQTQPDDPDSGEGEPGYGTLRWWRENHPDLLVNDDNGEPVVDPDWDEGIFDVSTADKRDRLLDIEKEWIDGCAEAGYQAVEPDNLDAYTRSQEAFDLDATAEFMTGFVQHAHSRGLAVAQKNTTELGARGRDDIGFDFAVAEECAVHEECDAYTDVYGPHVLEIEYSDQDRSAFTDSCAERGDSISIVRRDRDVVPEGAPGYHREECP